jgi:L-ribulose-5-phosphate 3-epimerase
MTPQSLSQLGVCSWSMLAKNAGELADVCAKVGVKKVQLALVPHRDDPGALDGVPEALAAKGITVTSGMFGTVGEDYTTPQTIKETGGVAVDKHWNENVQIARTVAKTANKMGLTLVSMHAGFLPHDDDDPVYRKVLDRVTVIAKIFADSNIVLLFETGQEDADNLLTFMEHLNAMGAKNTAVNFDPANMILYDMGDPVESLSKLMPYVKQIHIKDAIKTKVPGTWGQEVVVGTGQVKWDAFMDVLAKGDYRGDMMIEREAGNDRVGDAKKAVDFLRKYLK